MYVELDLKFDRTLDRDETTATLLNIAGGNRISVDDALKGTQLANVNGLAKAALAAEQIRTAATIIYFMEGPDTVKVHIEVRSLVDARNQCVRLTRQISKAIRRLGEAKAAVFVQVRETDEDILRAKRVSFWKRVQLDMSGKIFVKVVPAGVVLAVANIWYSGGPVVQSAIFGAIAALAAIVVEIVVFAWNADEWVWKDTP